DPLPRWSFGRVTLLGDAAHPMVPRGSNGAGQAILDARALTAALVEHGNAAAALAVYEKQRLDATTRIVLTNRINPPDAILREVFERTNDQPFEAIEDVISRAELLAMSDSYKRIAGFSREALRAGARRQSRAETIVSMLDCGGVDSMRRTPWGGRWALPISIID